MDDPYVYKCPVFEDYHDPLSVRRKLYLLSGGDIMAWLDDQKGDDITLVMQTHEKLLPVVREAFGLPPIDRDMGAGVSDERALQVLSHFVRWLEGKA